MRYELNIEFEPFETYSKFDEESETFDTELADWEWEQEAGQAQFLDELFDLGLSTGFEDRASQLSRPADAVQHFIGSASTLVTGLGSRTKQRLPTANAASA
jgi:hypothetical protein